ncbi:MAG: alanine--tRNA ligase [Elusimicrobia bacterium GWC2_65_9]|nr:MAG: alanine--tRNA ligase [Elusimicrobia bacterium GWA2_66_18]OGR69374.1 MAG: alanine--tRNA ligase [Elusimicrobia bacterium GWC2_65_9]
MKTSAQLRQSYLDFFARNGHILKASTPIVPQGDATLMFNSAGMVPFKPYFLGLKKDLSRATSSQKCFRTTDIERVGTTLRHLTFFEMLGNFSFGDYFKAETVAWAWDFLTKEAGLDPERLHPTVFKEDDEAVSLWKKTGCPNPAVRLGEDTNFWNMGPTGPCGPCSEIYYDLGAEYASGRGDEVGGDGDRYIEIWNLVFTGFDRQADGSLKPLARACIDTGMGLERLAFCVQGKSSPFATDLFWPIVEKAASILRTDPLDPKNRLAYRVIADHARAATMLMSEGIVPTNVERGYVLRRLVRRAARYGQLMGRDTPFLHELVPAAVDIFAPGYPELRAASAQVQTVMKTEEANFLATLLAGEGELRRMLEKSGSILSGESAFRLYETFGFPLELTKEICGHSGVAVEESGFKTARSKAAQKARSSWKGSGEKDLLAISANAPRTEFAGYSCLECRATVVASSPGLAVLDRTPFYAEGGGQVADTGDLIAADGSRVLARVADTRKHGAVFVHLLEEGVRLLVGTEVRAQVDAERRARIAPHHTATHLMNEAMKRVLGGHIRQAGSYVGPDKLRFDFTHPKALTPDEIEKIEAIVNDEIKAAHSVAAKCRPVAMVAELGATTLLGEDYGAEPRFLLIGPQGWKDPQDRFSLELCGGTHVDNTSEILAFKIIRETSASAGVRRIEALAGKAVEEFSAAQHASRLKAEIERESRQRELTAAIEALGGKAPVRIEGLNALENQLDALKANKLAAQAEAGKQILEVKGVKVCVQRLDGADPKSLRGLSDKIKAELGSGLVFLATPGGGKLSFVLAATADLAAKGVDAAKIAKAFCAANGGSAGGRADFAQGGAADQDWDAAVASLTSNIAGAQD